MIKIILIAVVVLIVGLLLFINSRQNDFHVERSIVIAAPAATIFEQVNTIKKWEAWSPWAKVDPNMQQTYTGPASGVGAKSAWVGNKDVGEGNMTITESRPNELVKFRLEFIKPFAGTNTAEFTFKPEGNGTAVTWSMDGKSNFMMKGVGLFIDCDKMCGDQFEKGLADLKKMSESAQP